MRHREGQRDDSNLAAPIPRVPAMPTGPVLLAFALTAVMVLAVPGQAIAYVLTRSLEGGRRAGTSSALGLGTGSLLHAVATSVGLAAALAATDWAMTTIQLAGAAFLVHLGIRQFRSGPTGPEAPDRLVGPAAPTRLFVDGLVVDVLNPTKVVFFIAFLPQFVDPAQGPPGPQVMALALGFVPLAYGVYLTYALLASRVSTRIGEAARSRINRGTGVVYLGIAALTVLV